jgi:hypothetical protein
MLGTTIKNGESRFPETLVPIFQTTWCHSPKDSNRHFVNRDELERVLQTVVLNTGSDLE